MPYAVRCVHCGGWSRVDDGALGLSVACPHCRREFVARDVSLDRPSRNPTLPVTTAPAPPVFAPVAEDDLGPHDAHPATLRKPVVAAIGLALLPLGIPLGWLIAPALGLARPIFSFAAPTAVALGTLGLGLGIAHCYGWSVGARLRAVVAIVLVSYVVGTLLFLMNTEWAVAVRRNLPGPGDGPARAFRSAEGGYKLLVPGRPEPVEVVPLAGFTLSAYRSEPGGDRRGGFLKLVYEFAHGSPPDALGLSQTDEDYFAAVRAALAEATGGEVTPTTTPVEWRNAGGRFALGEFLVLLPDGARRRVVRVVRDQRRDRVFYLAVEGAFLPADLREVRGFFRSFEIAPVKQ